MRQRGRTHIIQTHPIQDDLETEMLQLKPRLDMLQQLEELYGKDKNDQLHKQIQEAKSNIKETVEQLGSQFGVDVFDIYSRLQAEKFKNDILESRDKQKKKQQEGIQDHEVVDLLNENGVLIRRGERLDQLENRDHPLYKHYARYKSYRQGMHQPITDEEDIKAQERISNYLQTQYGKHPSMKFQMVIPYRHVYSGTTENPLTEHIQRQEYVEGQRQVAEQNRMQREELQQQIDLMMRRQRQENIVGRVRQHIEERKQQQEEQKEQRRQQEIERYIQDLEKQERYRDYEALEGFAQDYDAMIKRYQPKRQQLLTEIFQSHKMQHGQLSEQENAKQTIQLLLKQMTKDLEQAKLHQEPINELTSMQVAQKQQQQTQQIRQVEQSSPERGKLREEKSKKLQELTNLLSNRSHKGQRESDLKEAQRLWHNLELPEPSEGFAKVYKKQGGKKYLLSLLDVHKGYAGKEEQKISK